MYTQILSNSILKMWEKDFGLTGLEQKIFLLENIKVSHLPENLK